MFKLFGTLFKMGIFSIVVLVLGNWIQWNGRTLSDQVRLSMSHAERSGIFSDVQKWAKKVTQDAQQGFKSKVESTTPAPEEISSSERQKLKALIKELNSTHRKTD